jgi:hypothetical protein
MQASWLKGLIVGACTACAAAIAITGYIAIEDGMSNPLPLLIVVAVIGVVPGIGVGAAAGAIADRLPVARRTVLISLGMLGVIALGMLTAPELIPVGALPVIAGALVLERWTRENLTAPRPPRRPPTPVLAGMMIGLANAAVVAAVVAIALQFQSSHDLCHSHGHGFEIAIALFFVGGVLALPLGAVIGGVAGALGAATTTVRRLVLGGLAGCCILLGPAAHIPLDIAVAALPSTLISALVLEHLTRRAPPLPPARALV